ncbi:hypothetical protein AALO_G00034030 [Alosa alosa]|uniref:Adhesion G-protein coupled receptor G2 n=1 Tax=Alosa alosa TaxID=278164 RepID=A0AAV6HGB8_9TELE|nr:adhesion G-protein coupled receptor G2 isoform X2 [Alosa alosa]KAG5285095.1 hypothetical protein AALO_G00034030 [Alosa alosa]
MFSPENGTDSSVFQDIDVCCEEKEKIGQTICVAVVKLSARRRPCCFRYALWNTSLSDSGPIYASIQNNSVTLIRGMWPDKSSSPPSGNMSNCNSSESSSTRCSSTSTSSSSSVNCTRPVGTRPERSADNCSNEFVALPGRCNCSQGCDSVAYYSMVVTINNSSITQQNIAAMVNKLNQSPTQKCSSSNSTCQAVETISGVYQESGVVCDGKENGGCVVILKLSQITDRCTVATALSFLLNQSGITMATRAWRVALCGPAASLSGDLRSEDFTRQSINFTAQQFCASGPASLSILDCQPGKTLIVQLNEGCPSVSPPTASSTSTPTSPSTSPNVSMTTPVSSNTTRPTHSTTSAGGGPANSTAQSSAAPLTNSSSTAATHTSPGAQNSTATTPSPASTATNSSSGSTVTTSTPETQATATAAGNSSAEMAADQLLALTQDASSLNSSQVEQLVSQLEVLLSGPNVSLALGRTSVNIANNLLNASAAAVASSSTRLIRIVDTVGLKLEVSGESESILFDSLALAVSRVDGTNFRETTISIADPTNLQIVPRVVRSVSWVEGRTDPPQGSITLPSTLTDVLSPQQQQEASRVLFNFYQRSTFFQDAGLKSGELNSGILSTSVANLSISGLQDNITITLKNNKPIPENSSVSCAFWDFTLNDGSGGWNDVGCSVVNVTDEQTICSCSHLTSFGILLDLSRGDEITSRLQATILTYITYIGCGISAIFLSITLLTYLAFGKLRKDIPSKILIQLCFALLLLNLVFLLDAWLALYPDAVGLCISTAFFLHYFLLAAFTWMGLEAVHMYIALVKVFNSYISHFMLKFSLVGWGIPLLVVIIVIAIDKDNYGLVSYGKYEDGTTDNFCWLRNGIAFYVAVVAYFCVIFVMNLAMFVVVLVQLRRIKQNNPQNVQHRSHLQDARSIAGLTVLLGLTWGFAFFAWGPVNLAFMYLFAIFNTLQGFFIFVFHCAVKENVRRQWRTYLCCGKMRLAENSDWSRTATQNKNKKSYISGSQNSSSSTTCLAPESSVRTRSTRGSPSDDRIISDTEINSDVVQNQINSQYHNPSRAQADWIRPRSDSRGS